MKIKVFVGLTFFPDNAFAIKIQNFRKRFDTKFLKNPDLYIPLLPPFEVDYAQLDSLHMSLKEELDGFFYENAHHELKFSGIDIFEYKKNKILYLNPQFSEEIRWCQESLIDICQYHITEREKRIKTDEKIFMTIGRFDSPESLGVGVEQARREFYQFTSLSFQGISLFHKSGDEWKRQRPLIEFTHSSTL